MKVVQTLADLTVIIVLDKQQLGRLYSRPGPGRPATHNKQPATKNERKFDG